MEILLTHEETPCVDIFRSTFTNPQNFIDEIVSNHNKGNIRKFTLSARVEPKLFTFNNKYIGVFLNFLSEFLTYISNYDFKEIEIDNFDPNNCYIHKNKNIVIVYITKAHAYSLRALDPHELDLTISHREKCRSEYCYRVSFDIDDIVHIEKIQ